MSTPMKKTKVLPEETLDVVIEEIIDFPARSVREVWHSVFEKLDKNDKPNFSRACTDWYSWVEGKRTQFLFPEVAPKLLQDLTNVFLLENRDYCKSWKEMGDHHSQSHPSHLQLLFEKEGIGLKKVYQSASAFTSTENVNVFMNEMRTHQGNPFPGRCTHFLYMEGFKEQTERDGEVVKRSCREFWTSVTQLLEKFGTQVHFAAICLIGSEHLGIELDHILRACLLLLPNLKRFRILGDSGAPENQLIEFYQPRRLPVLEHLETLEVDNSNQQMMEHLSHFCCIPSKLKRLSPLNNTAPGYQLQLQHLTSLEVLTGRFSLVELESFSNLPLSSLCLNAEGSFGQIFNTLAAFQETLIHLKIYTKMEEPQPAERSGLRLSLPKLKRLELFEYTGSLDLFVQLPALTVFSIEYYHLKSDQGETELVQVFGFEDRMMESNIWSLMPSLQKLSLDWDGETFERVT